MRSEGVQGAMLSNAYFASMNSRLVYPILCLTVILLNVHLPAFSQKSKVYTRADTLRGSLSTARTAYDVTYYDLYLSIFPEKRSIQGYNTIHFKAKQAERRLQFDLFSNMKIDSVVFRGEQLAPQREHHAFFVYLPIELVPEQMYSLSVYYQGVPQIAANPPWDGGFVWKKDEKQRPFIGVACEGTGASLWWPCKDHLSDEPDSMRIQTEVPAELFSKSNGRLADSMLLENGRKLFDWRVSYPINNYNVTLNIGHYAYWKDSYSSEDGDELGLHYYVLDYQLEKAKKQFEQVKPMLKCYEQYFGKYPFWNDGFSLVETPYLGMEHQGAVAYGNQYLNGYMGFDRSRTGWGNKWDYIIIHETGHEYWGNLVSVKDHAELWIHESFCTYTEGLYVECLYGKEAGQEYLNGLKHNIGNRSAIVGPLGLNASGSGDMYDKGAIMLNTVRNLIGKDSLWFQMLRGLTREFGYKTTDTREVVDYILEKSQMPELEAVFNQYLYQAAAPVLEYEESRKGKEISLRYRWVVQTEGFQMPVPLIDAAGQLLLLPSATEWKEVKIKGSKKYELSFKEDLYYFLKKKVGN